MSRRNVWVLRQVAVLLVLLGFTCLPLAAQDADGASAKEESEADIPEMVTDRPDQTESSSVVAPGYVQVEIGVTRSENDDDGIETETDEILQTLVRIGLVDRLEARIGFAGFLAEEVSAPGGSTDDSGAGDLSIGSKFYICPQQDWRPEMAVLGTLSLPTGEESSERVDPSFRFLASHQLNEQFSVAANMGVAWESDEDSGGSRHTLSSFEWTAVVGAGVYENTAAYLEFFGDSGLSRSGGPRNSVNVGGTYLLSPNLQLDASAGVGLSEDADDWFIGVGLSLRFPK